MSFAARKPKPHGNHRRLQSIDISDRYISQPQLARDPNLLPWE